MNRYHISMFEIEYLHPDHFDWLTWNGGRLLDIGVQTRFEDIKAKAHIVRKHAIGYLWGESLVCRTKPGTVAVMFLIRETDTYFWTHLTMMEFEVVFPYIKVPNKRRHKNKYETKT